MNEEEVLNWINKLPKSELDIPLVVIDDRAYTPNEILEMVRRKVGLGRRLLTLDVSTLKRVPAEPQLHELAKIRLKKKLEEMPKKFVLARYVLGKKEKYSADELIEEIERESPIGREFIDTEKKIVRDLLSR